MAELQRLKWFFPTIKAGFEELDLNRDGKEVLWDAPAGNAMRAPLGGVVTAVRPDHRVDPASTPLMMEIEIRTITDDGDYIYNIISGLVNPVAVDTEVKRGDMIGRTGPGVVGDWDQTWTAYLNFAGDEDADGEFVNPAELADAMGGIVFPPDPDKRGLPVQPEKPEAAPTFDMTLAPPPADNRKLIMLALGGVAAWYFLKKGAK